MRCHKIKTVDISMVLSEAIRRTYHKESMGKFFGTEVVNVIWISRNDQNPVGILTSALSAILFKDITIED